MKLFKEQDIKELTNQVSIGDISFSKMVEIINDKAKQYATEVAKEALKNASENVQMEREKYTDDYIPCRASILNQNNIPKL